MAGVKQTGREGVSFTWTFGVYSVLRFKYNRPSAGSLEALETGEEGVEPGREGGMGRLAGQKGSEGRRTSAPPVTRDLRPTVFETLSRG